jgi:catechol 2,3-dioxygenase-like lactoylglutathione lyase family enzyme
MTSSITATNSTVATAHVERLARVGVNSSNIDRLADFYCRAFDCAIEDRQRHSGSEMGRLMGVRGGAQSLRLRLGVTTLELLQFDEPGRPYRTDFSASDSDFQHFAIVVADMDDAYGRLGQVSGWTALSTAGPQQLPASSGGVRAFKFRDPDGHPLELLSFPAERAPAPWKEHDPKRMFLGIDHSAIAVAQLERAIQYYENLGLRVSTRAVNQGVEQQRLDGISDAIVDVIGLALQVPTPHVELLHYREKAARAGPSLKAHDMPASRLIFQAAASAVHDAGIKNPELLQDPDGHFIQIVHNGQTLTHDHNAGNGAR